MNNFETIKKEDRLLLEYIRGSHLYGLNTENSDVDTGGIYICKPEEYIGFIGYQPQVSDAKHDNTWYEVGNFIQLLTKSNPTVMEALFCPEDKRLHWDHRLDELYEYRNHLLTTQIFWPFYGYAKAQIEKARGLNKKIVNPIYERKTPLDFTYTFKKQGSQPILQWLEERGLKPEYCGLNAIPHMHNIYGLYYDWGAHIEGINDWEEFNKLNPTFQNSFMWYQGGKLDTKVCHYRGLVCDEVSKTSQLRLSSIDDKDDLPLCHISFNSSGFQDHCRKYKEYQDWVKERNPVRYESNLNKTYDSKNMMHCFRLIHMAQEILSGQGFNLVRTWDKQFLLDVRNHKYEYDELIQNLEEKKVLLELTYKMSNLPDEINREELNQILINIRTNANK